ELQLRDFFFETDAHHVYYLVQPRSVCSSGGGGGGCSGSGSVGRGGSFATAFALEDPTFTVKFRSPPADPLAQPAGARAGGGQVTVVPFFGTDARGDAFAYVASLPDW